jgi:AraC family transcriptional regulator
VLGETKLRMVLEHIESSLHTRLGVAAMAAVAGLSRFHFSRAFTKTVGQSPHAYLTGRRIELAKRLLRERPELSLAQISTLVGYRTHTQFAGVFGRVVGTTPGRYRRGFAGR